jgi:phosphate:Na+ symporter
MDPAELGAAAGPMVVGLLGGLALFLLGLEQLTRSLRSAAGDSLKTLLARMSRNPVTAATGGAVSTALLQSSSVTTVLVIGFTSAGLLTLQQAAGIIIGANLGSTATAQVIAFDVAGFSLAMIGVGFAGRFLRRPRWAAEAGEGLLGLGLVFLGMSFMGGAVSPLRDDPRFADFLAGDPPLLLALLAGLAFTALVQSSAATIGVVIVLASQGLLALPAAIAVTLGANVGTCVTAGLAAIGRPRTAVRAAVIHVVVNVVGVLLWVGFIDQLAALVTWMSPSSPELAGSARLAAETPRQVANAHTVFNLANTILFIGLTHPLARLAERLVPAGADDVEAQDPRYLDDDAVSTPAVALELARLEIVRLAERVQVMVDSIVPTALTGSARQLRAIAAMDHDVDRLHRLIVVYLARVGQARLSEEESAQMLKLLGLSSYLEQVGDVVETNLVALGLNRIDEHIRPSAGTIRVVQRFHALVREQFGAVVTALADEDPTLARRVRAAKGEVTAQRREAAVHQAERLLVSDQLPGAGRARAYTRETEIIEQLRRIYALSRGLSGELLDRERMGRERARRDPAPPGDQGVPPRRGHEPD